MLEDTNSLDAAQLKFDVRRHQDYTDKWHQGKYGLSLINWSRLDIIDIKPFANQLIRYVSTFYFNDSVPVYKRPYAWVVTLR